MLSHHGKACRGWSQASVSHRVLRAVVPSRQQRCALQLILCKLWAHLHRGVRLTSVPILGLLPCSMSRSDMLVQRKTDKHVKEVGSCLCMTAYLDFCALAPAHAAPCRLPSLTCRKS